MPVARRDIAVAIAALVAFPLVVNLPAQLASDGSPRHSSPLFDRGAHDQARVTEPPERVVGLRRSATAPPGVVHHVHRDR